MHVLADALTSLLAIVDIRDRPRLLPSNFSHALTCTIKPNSKLP